VKQWRSRYCHIVVDQGEKRKKCRERRRRSNGNDRASYVILWLGHFICSTPPRLTSLRGRRTLFRVCAFPRIQFGPRLCGSFSHAERRVAVATGAQSMVRLIISSSASRPASSENSCSRHPSNVVRLAGASPLVPRSKNNWRSFRKSTRNYCGAESFPSMKPAENIRHDHRSAGASSVGSETRPLDAFSPS